MPQDTPVPNQDQPQNACLRVLHKHRSSLTLPMTRVTHHCCPLTWPASWEKMPLMSRLTLHAHLPPQPQALWGHPGMVVTSSMPPPQQKPDQRPALLHQPSLCLLVRPGPDVKVHQTWWSTLGSGSRQKLARTGSPLAGGENSGPSIKSTHQQPGAATC